MYSVGGAYTAGGDPVKTVQAYNGTGWFPVAPKQIARQYHGVATGILQHGGIYPSNAQQPGVMFAIGGSNSSDITAMNAALASVEMYTPRGVAVIVEED